MSTNATKEQEGSVGVLSGEPGGRAGRGANGALALRELLPDELIDGLLAGVRSEEEIVGPGGLLSQLTKRVVERAMNVELAEHLGYEHGQPPSGGAGNTRNGATPKTLQTEHGPVGVDTPRDRARDVRAADRAQGASVGSPALTRRSSRSTPAACRCGTSRRTWPRSTGSKSATT